MTIFLETKFASNRWLNKINTVYPKKYAHGFVVLCFVVVMQSLIMNSHEVLIHIHQGCFAGTGAIVRLPQCQWSKPDGYGKISQCITTTKHSKAKTVCIFLGIYCRFTRARITQTTGVMTVAVSLNLHLWVWTICSSGGDIRIMMFMHQSKCFIRINLTTTHVLFVNGWVFDNVSQ